MPTQNPKHTQLPDKYSPGFLAEMDGRTVVAKELRAHFTSICDDLGGEENLTHIKLTLVERFCFLEVLLGHWELEIAADPKSRAELVGRWVQGVNSLQGLGRMLGIERRAKAGRLAAHLEAQCQ